MDGTDYMYASAEIGVALAGFAAIVIALRQREATSLSGAYKLVAASLIERGFVAAFLSLLPILLTGLDLSGRMVWLVSSGTFVLYGLSLVIRALYNRRAVTDAAKFISEPVYYVLICLALLVIALQLLHAFALGIEQNAWWYLVAITWLLASAGYRFIIVLRGWIRGG